MLVVDPPWAHKDKLGLRGADRHYKSGTMSLEAIKRFKLPPLEPDCVLFLWRVETMLQEALDVARAWGFNPTKGGMIWRKLTVTGKEHFGMGYIVRGAHEGCIIATRGKPKIKRRDVRSIFSAPVPREGGKVKHSAKPDLFFALVRSMYDGPRASLFERTQRTGFKCFGDEMQGELACTRQLELRYGVPR